MNNKLIKMILTGVISTALLLSPAAFAGHNNHNYSNKHYSKKKNHHYGSHKKFNAHYKHKRKNNHVKHVIGGIIGGIVISNILDKTLDTSHKHRSSNDVSYNNHYRTTSYNTGHYPASVAVNKTVIINNTPTQTYRVLNGTDCYLVNINDQGSEIMTQVPKVNCGF